MRRIVSMIIAWQIGLLAIGQVDSTAVDIQDSILTATAMEGRSLQQQADSLRIADSLELAALEAEIAQLQADDDAAKAELQERMDSLRQAQVARDERIKMQVDSLRANTPGIPVVIFGDTAFYIYSKLGPFSPSDRAGSIASKIEVLVDEGLFDETLLQVVEGEESHDVIHGDIILFSVTERDAFWLDENRAAVAENYMNEVREVVTAYVDSQGVTVILKRIGLILLVMVVFLVGISLLNRGFTAMNKWIVAKGKRFIKGVRFRNYEFLSVEREVQFVKWLLRMLKWLTILVLVYVTLPVALSIFPATKGLANTLFGYILDPIKSMFKSMVGYIPELITIIVIIMVTRYVVRFLHFLSTEVETGKLQLPGFYTDWARPTYNLLKIIIYAFSFIVIFPYLPGSDSPVFQGVSVFLGLLISLGSSSAIGNIIAGLVITYMRAFKVGDRVQIGETSGDVMEKTMLVTRLKTIKNEEVTIPNSAILNGSTINYTNGAKEEGLILHTTITIGYDVPWNKVHELLLESAKRTELLLAEPKPFVLQTSLDDFYVSYQLNAYTVVPAKASRIYSELHGHILDVFHAAGVEIMSPHFVGARDGSAANIPAKDLPEDYTAPSFNVKIRSDGSSKQ